MKVIIAFSVIANSLQNSSRNENRRMEAKKQQFARNGSEKTNPLSPPGCQVSINFHQLNLDVDMNNFNEV